MKEFRLAIPNLALALFALTINGCILDNDAEPAAADTVSIEIINPGAAEIDTSDASITISGTATADSTIASVEWMNDKSISGTAIGTESWQITNLPIVLGMNTITIIAMTTDGKSNSAQLIVNRESTGTKSVTLSWMAPTQRTDGSPLTNLAGYRINYGRMSQNYDYELDISNPGVQTFVVDGLVPGQWFFVASAYDSEGFESNFSDEASVSVQ